MYTTPLTPRAQPFLNNELIIANMTKALSQFQPETIDLVFLDPPFNLGKNYGRHINDAYPQQVYWKRLRLWLTTVLPLITSTGSLVLHHLPLWAYRAATWLEDQGLHFQSWVVWDARSNHKRQPRLGARHYAFLWFSRSPNPMFQQIKMPHPRCKRCGEYSTHWGGKEKFRNPAGQRVTDVWNTSLNRIFPNQKTRRANELPLEAVLRWILMLTQPGDRVLDPFLGSGTTAAACELSRRQWSGIEMDADNLPAIQAKSLTARGVGHGLPHAIDAFSAHHRANLTHQLMTLWAENLKQGVDCDTMINTGKNLAKVFQEDKC